MNRLDPGTFALTLGCLWGAIVLILGFAAGRFERGKRIVRLLATVYRGYTPTLAGSLIGACWGFIDGAITGILVAWIYNALAG